MNTLLDYIPAIPEIFLLFMICVAIIVTLYAPVAQRNTLTYSVAQFALLGAAIFTVLLYGDTPLMAFSHSFVLDKTACVLKLFIYLCSFAVFLFARYNLADAEIASCEYYILGLFSILGMMILVSAYNFLTLYLGLEILSLPLYAMVALRRDARPCVEAAMKFFVMGAFASAMLLYGISMIYGVTNSIEFAAINKELPQLVAEENLIVIFGLVFLLAGIVFKFGAVPFHLWVPDVYQGAPNAVTLFISAAPKIAALGLVLRILLEAMPDYALHWRYAWLVIAILSMGLGNFVAIVQTNMKRMLAYSSIAHMGYMALGLIAGTPNGYAATIFYIISYALMSVGAFGLLTVLSQKGNGLRAEHDECSEINHLRGLNQRHPWLAFVMLLLMFSLAGIPPTFGFIAKLSVLQALLATNQVWLATIALIFAVVGSYYYIYVVKVMYFEKPNVEISVTLNMDTRLMISASGLLVLGMGIFPGALMSLCQSLFHVS